jgi:hypothetical protein
MKKLFLIIGLMLGFVLSSTTLGLANSPEAFDSLCSRPVGLMATARDSSANLVWFSTRTAVVSYTIQWKSRRDSVWNTVVSDSTRLVLRGLSPCTDYEFRVKSSCPGTTGSNYTEIRRFKTTGCVAPCSAPREVRGIGFDSNRVNTIVLAWVPSGVRSYEVQMRDSGATSWSAPVVVSTPFFIARNLATCRLYQFRVRTVCGAVFSEYSPIVSIRSSGCPVLPRCEAPRRITASDITANGALIAWDTTSGAAYLLEYRNQRDSAWRSIRVVANRYILSGLVACLHHQVRVSTVCNGQLKRSHTINFTTAGCAPVCAKPNRVRLIGRDTSVVVSWDSLRGQNTYNVQIRRSNDTSWRTIRVTGISTTISGLNRCELYTIRVQTVCSPTSVSGYSEQYRYQTPCRTLCETPDDVRVNVDARGGFAVVTWESTNAARYVVEWSRADNSTIQRDTVFGSAKTLLFANTPCASYLVRVRALCQNGTTSEPSAWKPFRAGNCNTGVCEAPILLSANSVNDSIATIFISGAGGGSATFNVQYRIVGDSSWTTINGVFAQSAIGVQRCKTYQWRAQTVCSPTTTSEWSRIYNFTTNCTTTSCFPPGDVRVENLAVGTRVSWNGGIVPNLGGYLVTYRADSSRTEDTMRIMNGLSSVVLSNLTACRFYTVRIRTMCSGTISAPVERRFRAGTNCFAGNGNQDFTSGNAHILSTTAISPNPGSDFLNIAYNLETAGDVVLELVNTQGATVRRTAQGVQVQGAYAHSVDGLNTLPNGLYVVVIRHEGKVVSAQKWVKE